MDGPFADADVALLDEVYAGPLASGTPRMVTDYATAELVKVAANAFLAIKISFINAMAEASTRSVTAAATAPSPRTGNRLLQDSQSF